MTSGKSIPAYDRPTAAPNSRIGLLGGSFDPAHAGHLHISKQAIKKFDLDAVWWLMSPGNPLKTRQPAPIARRMQAAQKLVKSGKILVSDVEVKLGTRFTAETLAALLPLYPEVGFVWLMGADNLASFHKWQRWQWILKNVHVGVLARPGDRLAARGSKAASVYKHAKLGAAKSRRLLQQPLPAWCFVNVPMVDDSSTRLRADGNW